MRKKLYAKINITKNKLGLDETTYRAFLTSATGKNSLKKMSMADLKKIIITFEGLGYKDKRTSKPYVDEKLQAYIDKIGALLAELGRVRKKYVPWEYASSILAQMYNIPTWQSADWKQLQGVIVALTNQLKVEENGS